MQGTRSTEDGSWTAQGFEDGGPFYGYFGTYNYNHDSAQNVSGVFTTSPVSCYGGDAGTGS